MTTHSNKKIDPGSPDQPAPVFFEPLEQRVLLSAVGLSSLVALPLTAPAGSAVATPGVHVNANVSGLQLFNGDPSNILTAYGFAGLSFIGSNGQAIAADGTGQTIAIVDAYKDPNIANDLKYFDSTFGLSSSDGAGKFALTTHLMSSSTHTDSGWAMEMALDVEWAHVVAPGAHILLVEARSASYNDLLSAVDYARKQSGVVAVSMSWGGSEFYAEANYDSHFTTPSGHIGGSGLPGGVTFLASSGDYGAPPSYPSVSPNVVSVGGTTLTTDASGNYAGETGWSGSGGGVAVFERMPSYQAAVSPSGFYRTNPDVAYNADPSAGYYVYDSVPYYGQSGWWLVGGTSAGSPQWAGLIAIADQGRALAGKGSLDGPSQTLPVLYGLPSSDFHDIIGGNNGYPASPGYDLVTGLGSPYANLVIQGLQAVAPFSAARHALSSALPKPARTLFAEGQPTGRPAMSQTDGLPALAALTGQQAAHAALAGSPASSLSDLGGFAQAALPYDLVDLLAEALL